MTCGWQQVNTTGPIQQNSLLAATPALGKSTHFPLCSTAEEIRMLFVLRDNNFTLSFFTQTYVYGKAVHTPVFLLKKNPWQLVPFYIIHFANNTTQ